MDGVRPDRELDCVGLFCPMPILRTREAMRGMSPGQVLEMVADDPASETDMQVWATRTGHELLAVTKNGPIYRFLVRKVR